MSSGNWQPCQLGSHVLMIMQYQKISTGIKNIYVDMSDIGQYKSKPKHSKVITVVIIFWMWSPHSMKAHTTIVLFQYEDIFLGIWNPIIKIRQL